MNEKVTMKDEIEIHYSGREWKGECRRERGVKEKTKEANTQRKNSTNNHEDVLKNLFTWRSHTCWRPRPSCWESLLLAGALYCCTGWGSGHRAIRPSPQSTGWYSPPESDQQINGAKPNIRWGDLIIWHQLNLLLKMWSETGVLYLSTQVDHVGVRVIVGEENAITGVHLLHCHWLRHIPLQHTDTIIRISGHCV